MYLLISTTTTCLSSAKCLSTRWRITIQWWAPSLSLSLSLLIDCNLLLQHIFTIHQLRQFNWFQQLHHQIKQFFSFFFSNLYHLETLILFDGCSKRLHLMIMMMMMEAVWDNTLPASPHSSSRFSISLYQNNFSNNKLTFFFFFGSFCFCKQARIEIGPISPWSSILRLLCECIEVIFI